MPSPIRFRCDGFTPLTAEHMRAIPLSQKKLYPVTGEGSQAGPLFGARQQCVPIEIERECICTKCRSEDIFEFIKGDRSGAVTEQSKSVAGSY